jgi:hypothetical protein
MPYADGKQANSVVLRAFADARPVPAPARIAARPIALAMAA